VVSKSPLIEFPPSVVAEVGRSRSARLRSHVLAVASKPSICYRRRVGSKGGSRTAGTSELDEVFASVSTLFEHRAEIDREMVARRTGRFELMLPPGRYTLFGLMYGATHVAGQPHTTFVVLRGGRPAPVRLIAHIF
jgi:hypothetical protein